jgi:Cys-tRNA(Pro)/Cys-tRNA(Cys) deacylase
MAKKIEKTNAARLLDKAGLKYDLIPYEFDENDLAAQHVADSLGQDISRVFKTLVLHGDKTGHLVCVIPGNCEVDLKALAKESGNKKVEMILMKDLLAVTGYIRGGCSPIGMKKRFPTYFHNTATDHETIFVSAGVRGLQIEIAPSDLINFVQGKLADVTVPLEQ